MLQKNGRRGTDLSRLVSCCISPGALATVAPPMAPAPGEASLMAEVHQLLDLLRPEESESSVRSIC